MQNAKYKLLILLATVIWGLSFVIMKDTLDSFGPNTIIGIRFLLCGAGLALIFAKRMRAHFDKGTIIRGCILGVWLFLAYSAQNIGLDATTPGKNAFLTATYCVMVPFLWWAFRRHRPPLANVAAAILCVTGIGLVSLSSADGVLSMGFGDGMTLVGALFFAVHIVFVSMFVPGRDVYVLTVYQFLMMGVLGFAIGLLTEQLPVASSITWSVIFNLAYLTVLASGAALLFQNIGLAHVPPAQASLLLSLESIFGVLFSVLLYGEHVTLRLILGFALIFIAIVVSELKGSASAPAPSEKKSA